jgi:hypothetical protein
MNIMIKRVIITTKLLIMNLIGRKNGINIINGMKIRKNILEIRKEYQMILFIIIFNKLIRLKKEKIKNII